MRQQQPTCNRLLEHFFPSFLRLFSSLRFIFPSLTHTVLLIINSHSLALGFFLSPQTLSLSLCACLSCRRSASISLSRSRLRSPALVRSHTRKPSHIYIYAAQYAGSIFIARFRLACCIQAAERVSEMWQTSDEFLAPLSLSLLASLAMARRRRENGGGESRVLALDPSLRFEGTLVWERLREKEGLPCLSACRLAVFESLWRRHTREQRKAESRLNANQI